MGVVKLSTAGILDYQKYSSFLAGNSPVSLSAYDLLETEILTGTQASVTFSSLNSTYGADYQHLQIRTTMDATGNFGSPYDVFVTLNGDTGSNYYTHGLRGNGTSATSFNYGPNYLSLAMFTASTTSASNAYAASVVDILDPFSSDKNTTLRILTGLAPDLVGLQSVLWNNTAALTSFTMTPHGSTSFVTGSRFSLYGLRAA
jgi:hypothetical protein